MGKYPCNLPFLLWGEQGEKGPLKLAARCQQHARAGHRGGRTGHTKHTNGDDETSECTVPGHWTMMHFFRIVS